jgi:hypothetical protein
VLREPGLDEDATAPLPTAHQPGRPSQQGQRLLGRPVTGGKELLVEIQEGNTVDLRQSVQNGLGADEDRRVGKRSRLGGDLTDRTAR